MSGPLVVVGDALLDRDLDGTVDRLCPDAPVPVVADPVGRARPGGAALAAVLAARTGADVVLVAAMADDAAAAELRDALADHGVILVGLPLAGATPEKVRICAGGRPLLRLDHASQPEPPGPLTDAGRDVLGAAGAVLVSDYGRGLTGRADVRAELARRSPRTPIVWDPHPRGADPVAGVQLATPSRAEAAGLCDWTGGEPSMADVAGWARTLVGRWEARSVAVTLSERGALLVGPDGPPMAVPAPAVGGTDPCGAGDRFAATAATALLDGALPSEAVTAAVRAASAFVDAGGARGLLDGAVQPVRHAGGDAHALARRVRAEGGTVVTTGGCFDLLHAGHVGMLEAASRLGDCLIVCVNSDASVRRLKGPRRPLQSEDDRAALLRALDCVDAVAVFDDDTPVPLLHELRPHVFAKGGDYAGADLPEAAALAQWGGQAVVLPYLPGRSTTELIGLVDVRPTPEGAP